MKATLFGATGLVGCHILDYLSNDNDFTAITIIVRRPIKVSTPKVTVKLIDFDDKNAFLSAIEADSIIFCCIGTTQKKVKGNMKKYRQIDYDIPVNAAKFGLEKNCKKFSLVSSIGANSKSSNFYTKLKGEVEDEISRLNFPSIHIFQPSLLLGKRNEFRVIEKIGKITMSFLSFLIPSKFKAIQAKDVAKAMVKASKLKSNEKKTFTYKEIQELI